MTDEGVTMTINDVKRMVEKNVPGAYAHTIYENSRYFIVTMAPKGARDLKGLVANGARIEKSTGKFSLMPSNPILLMKMSAEMEPGKLVYTA